MIVALVILAWFLASCLHAVFMSTEEYQHWWSRAVGVILDMPSVIVASVGGVVFGAVADRAIMWECLRYPVWGMWKDAYQIVRYGYTY